MRKIIALFACVLVMMSMGQVQAQNKKEKVNYDAKDLVNGRRGSVRYQKLIGDVVFSFKKRNAQIYADSAYYYRRKGEMECYGKVRIVENDSINITSRKLVYRTTERMAKLREDVVYSDGNMTLYTDFLDYNTTSKSAHYFNSGKIIDGENTLTSTQGTYYPNQKKMVFSGEVKLVNPEYTLETDSLIYNTVTKEATTFGYTKSTRSDGSTLDTPHGMIYDASSQESQVYSGVIETDAYRVKGDDMVYNKAENLYKVIGNVYMLSKKDSVEITGQEAYYDKSRGYTKIWGSPVMKKIMEVDTFYLSADTLIAVDNKQENENKMLAFHDVKIWKSDLQGIADSMAYNMNDSLIYLYDDPLLWAQRNQIEADSISLKLGKGSLDKMFLQRNAFIIMEDTVGNFNQIKGREMVAHFKGKSIEEVDVNGNSESLYFALKQDNSLQGLNRILCSNMKIFFEGTQPSEVRFYVKPEATFYPPHEITDELKVLKGLNWRKSDRPTLEDVLAPRGVQPADSTAVISTPAPILKEATDAPALNE